MKMKLELKATILAAALLLANGHEALAQSSEPKAEASDGRQRAGLIAENLNAVAHNPYVRIPVIDAYYENEKVWFIHTEVSASEMAERLTDMVSYATVYSPALGKVDTEAAGTIYVFKNGVSREGVAPWGGGPFHYQIDVLDSVPGEDDYTPLRNPHLVSWGDGAEPRILRSEQEILSAERAGELNIKRTDVIVNAPVVHPHPAP